MERYEALGERFDGEWGKFGRILHERMQRGLPNVGFSAGADQLSQHLLRKSCGAEGRNDGFGCARNVMVALHHEAGDDERLWNAARQNPHCLVFGLPNDSSLYLDQGVLLSGNHWQVIQFVVDRSWDRPEDQFHVKTRQGALVEHVGCDGWHWSFGGGERLVRIQSPDNRFHEVWFTSPGRLLHYWSRQPSRFSRIEDVLAAPAPIPPWGKQSRPRRAGPARRGGLDSSGRGEEQESRAAEQSLQARANDGDGARSSSPVPRSAAPARVTSSAAPQPPAIRNTGGRRGCCRCRWARSCRSSTPRRCRRTGSRSCRTRLLRSTRASSGGGRARQPCTLSRRLPTP